MAEQPPKPSDPQLTDTVADDRLAILPAPVPVVYEQVRLKFVEKQFPVDATGGLNFEMQLSRGSK